MSGVVLSGVFAPVVSTFDAATGELDGGAFRRNVRAHLGAGLAGVVAAGSSGEAALLDDDERRTLVAWARDAAGGAPVIAGVGAESTRATVRRAREAADAGADLVLVVAPHYYGRRMTDEALYAHFAAVADASPRPVLLYNIPVYAHLVLAPALVARLAAHPNVAGMKDSAGDLAMLARYAEARGPGFALLTGHAATLDAALGIGAGGAILAAALFAPAPALALVAARRAGLDAEAAAAQAALLPLARDIVAALGPAGLKCAMDLCGLDGGAPRAPLRPCDAHERLQVAAALSAAGVVPGPDRRATRAGPALAGTGPAGD